MGAPMMARIAQNYYLTWVRKASYLLTTWILAHWTQVPILGLEITIK